MPKEKTARRSARQSTQASTRSSRPSAQPAQQAAPEAENQPGPSGASQPNQPANVPPVMPQSWNLPARALSPVRNLPHTAPPAAVASPSSNGLTSEITNLVKRVVQDSIKEATSEILKQVTDITLAATQNSAERTPAPPQPFRIDDLETLGRQLPFPVQSTNPPP